MEKRKIWGIGTGLVAHGEAVQQSGQLGAPRARAQR